LVVVSSYSGVKKIINWHAQGNWGVNTDACGNGLNAFVFANGTKTELLIKL
jgi:hypothetical protein